MSESETLRIRGPQMAAVRDLARDWGQPVIDTLHLLLQRGIRDADMGLVCRRCGCAEWDACVNEAGEPCGWAEPELCSACALGDHLGPGLRACHLETETDRDQHVNIR